MAMKWIATNVGGFWEDDGTGGASTTSAPASFQSSQSPQPQLQPQLITQPINQNTSQQSVPLWGTNPFIQGAINQGNLAAAQSFQNVSNALMAAQNSGITVSPNNYSQITQPLIQSGEFGTSAIGNTLTADQANLVRNKIATDYEWQQAYENVPELKDVLAESARTGTTVASILARNPAVASKVPNWLKTNPNYVETRDPYLDDKDPWLKQNSGMLSGLASFAFGPLAGVGLAAATGGGIQGVKNAAIPIAAGSIFGNIAQRAGAFDFWKNAIGTGEGYAASTTGALSEFTGAAQQYPTFAEKVFQGTGGDVSQLGTTLQAGKGLTGYTSQMSQLKLPSSSPLNVANPELFTDIGNKVANVAGSQFIQKQIADTVNGSKKTSDATKGVMESIMNGEWGQAAQAFLGSDIGRQALVGLIADQISKSNQPELETPQTNINVTQEFEKRLDPKFYAMTQEEKDYLFNEYKDKIKASLGERGTTRGGVEYDATKKMIKEIELADMQNQRNAANAAFASFVDWLGGRESSALNQYYQAMDRYNMQKTALVQNLSSIADSVVGKDPIEEKRKEYTMWRDIIFGGQGGNI